MQKKQDTIKAQKKHEGKMEEKNAKAAETDDFIVPDKYERAWKEEKGYQSEADLEKELIDDLKKQGYEYLHKLKSPEQLLENARRQIEKLNNIEFNDKEWARFAADWLDAPNDGPIEKSEKIHHAHMHEFTFDNGDFKNIYMLDKKNLARNSVQIINQMEQKGEYLNRYDVTILVNGLPLAHIELKRRGVAIREAFNQIHRYSRESFNGEHSLFKYLQVFVISNGTDTRYFANTTKRSRKNYEFTINWAKANNEPIKDLKDFTATFLQKNTLLGVLLHYSVLNADNNLLVMRPYQIAAAERILAKIKSSHNADSWCSPESCGYIWHATGSGKTLTSFKAARLATELDFIDKVFFVVDRKDLDHQTIKEYEKFQEGSVNSTANTKELAENIKKNDKKIIVTTIQKLNRLMCGKEKLDVYNQKVVFIFDECHRSQFGEAQSNLKKLFRHYLQFGFTGTPIFKENSQDGNTTENVFGKVLHSYVLTDAIKDEKVLKFRIFYHNLKASFKEAENEQYLQKREDAEKKQELQKLEQAENDAALLCQSRLDAIADYILQVFQQHKNTNMPDMKGFNALLAVNSIEAAKKYYTTFKRLQKNSKKPLKVAAIFSFAANEAPDAKGEIEEESLEMKTEKLPATGKEFLESVIKDYNAIFNMQFSLEGESFQNYYKDIALRVKDREIDLLIVVGMFLTGFDAPGLNTLFVDKNLRYHGLIQAFSRTNRIYDATKPFGNIITFRNLEAATNEALKLFGDKNSANSADDDKDIGGIVLAKSFGDYLNGYKDKKTGVEHKGYTKVVQELAERFPDPCAIEKEEDKKEFVKLFGKFLRIKNELQNFYEYNWAVELQKIDKNNNEEIEKFKNERYLNDEMFETIKNVIILEERAFQNYCSVYEDVKKWLIIDPPKTDWSGIVFEVELLKTQIINFDYLLELIFNEKMKDRAELEEYLRSIIRRHAEHRAKESLIAEFINKIDTGQIKDLSSLKKDFYKFARIERQKEAEKLIREENLNAAEAIYYMDLSLEQKGANDNGMDFNAILPKMSPLNPAYLTKKRTVFGFITAFVEKFKDIGGKILDAA